MIDFKDIEHRMDGAIENLRSTLAGFRAGRTSVAILDNILVEAYGQSIPLTQTGTVNMPDSRLITIQVWDKGQIIAVEKAIIKADLGLTPVVEGQLIRLPIPQLSEERRKELVKLSSRAAEHARIAVRNVRHHGMEQVKASEKEISKDEARRYQIKIQEMTDKHVKKVDELFAEKEKDIMQR